MGRLGRVTFDFRPKPARKDVNVKFIYSEKETKFCEIFTSLLIAVHTVKTKVKISQNFVAFLEYMNFKEL